MDSNSIWDASKIFNTLETGREADRIAALEALTDPSFTIDRSLLRAKIVKWIEQKTPKECDEQEKKTDLKEVLDKPLLWTRSWLLCILARVCDDDIETARVVREHLNPDKEPRPWVRYWTLDGIVAAIADRRLGAAAAEVFDLEKIAQDIILQEEEWSLVHMVGVAILASEDDSISKKKIVEGLKSGNEKAGNEKQWITLRAIRIVPAIETPDIVNRLCEIVDDGKFSNEIYDAIIILGTKIQPKSQYAEIAAQKLSNLVKNYRRTPMRDSMRSKALIALGNLKVKSEADTLIQELSDDNPEIGREAARALEKVLDIKISIPRIIEAIREASKTNPDSIKRFANALRWMNTDPLIKELGVEMISGTPDQQEIAGKLLVEIGGVAAFQKFQALTATVNKYIKMMEESQGWVNALSEKDVKDARSGFNMVVIMEATIFCLGVVLIVISGYLVVSRGGTLDNWAGVGVAGVGLAGGGGLLGILYEKFIANRGKKIQDDVNHLMKLKVIFHAYLRQLQYTDQAFIRRLLDDKLLTSQEMKDFSEIVEKALQTATAELNKSKSDMP